MKGKLVRPAVVALAIVGALAVAGGIAYATIPDASGVIHACYNKAGQGTLRVIDTEKSQTCANSEAPLSWSQTGPQGQQGPQGLTGPTGPSDVYSVDGYNQGFKNVPKVPATETLATTPTLPAGSYFVEGQAELENNTFVAMDYFCDIVDSSANTYQEERATGSDWVTLPVQAVVTLSSPDTISLQCDATGALSEAFNWQLAAIKIGEVHS
jgi:hypothetical protein